MNRFDLEDQIQACWNTKDDIDLLLDSLLSHKLNTDQVANALIGISRLHEMRCERAFDTFTELVHSGIIMNGCCESSKGVFEGDGRED